MALECLVPLHGEEALVAKEAVIAGEVVIRREPVPERRDVADTVRAEHAEVIAQALQRRMPR